MKADNFALVRDLTAWKRIVVRLWDSIKVVEFRHPDISKDYVDLGESYQAEVKLDIGNLSSADIGVELVIPGYPAGNGSYTYAKEFELVNQENGHTTYRVEMTPGRPGVFEYGIRIYAKHEDLPHRQDFALVKWV
jgi:phosphorylase/glycogen(starch) synthase